MTWMRVALLIAGGLALCWLCRKDVHVPRLTAMRRLQALWDAEQDARLP